MTPNHRKKLITGLMTLQLIFLILFSLAFINLIHGRAIVNVGLSATFINWVVIVFCVISMINVLYELKRVN